LVRQLLEDSPEKSGGEGSERETDMEQSKDRDSETSDEDNDETENEAEYLHHDGASDAGSDASTTVLVEDWAPKSMWIGEDKDGGPILTLWEEGPSIEQVLMPQQAIQAFADSYPMFYQYYTNAPKIQVRPGKEVDRSIALEEQGFWEAMVREIDQLIANGARICPPPGGTHFVYSSRWVYTYKDDGTPKARLVVRGFEEAFNPASSDHATDSPTLHRDSIKLICLNAAHRVWKLQAWDIRTAFLQASTQDDPDQTINEKDGLWIKLPPHVPEKFRGLGVCLKIAKGKTLYGMASAPRRWYFTLRKVMLSCGFSVSKADDCLFLLRDKQGNVEGLAGWHVDDGLLTGNKNFWDKMKLVATKLEFGKASEKDFKFCGMRIRQSEDGTVHVDQAEQVAAFTEIKVDKKRPKTESCTPAEITELRGKIGAILYVTGMTRPYEAYEVSHLASWQSVAKVEHLFQCNELIRHMRDDQPDLGLTYQGSCELDCLYTFHDSSFKRERDSGSQMGIFTFVGPKPNAAGEIKGASLLRWASKRARRVCHSTMAAETLAATGGMDSQAGILFRMKEVGMAPMSIMLTDCRSLFDHLYSMTGKTAEVLLPDINELRELCMPWRNALSDEYKEEYVEMWWVNTNKMLADHLTKNDAPSREELLEVLRSGCISLGKDCLRPRSTQRAHSFGVVDLLGRLYESQRDINESA
jgi:hypothetical protein